MKRLQLTLFVYLAISAATSAETVGICKSPDIKEELPDVTWADVDEDALRGGSFCCPAEDDDDNKKLKGNYKTSSTLFILLW